MDGTRVVGAGAAAGNARKLQDPIWPASPLAVFISGWMKGRQGRSQINPAGRSVRISALLMVDAYDPDAKCQVAEKENAMSSTWAADVRRPVSHDPSDLAPEGTFRSMQRCGNSPPPHSSRRSKSRAQSSMMERKGAIPSTTIDP